MPILHPTLSQLILSSRGVRLGRVSVGSNNNNNHKKMDNMHYTHTSITITWTHKVNGIHCIDTCRFTRVVCTFISYSCALKSLKLKNYACIHSIVYNHYSGAKERWWPFNPQMLTHLSPPKIHNFENLDNLVEYNVWFLVHFWQFPTFNCGLVHFASEPFII